MPRPLNSTTMFVWLRVNTVDIAEVLERQSQSKQLSKPQMQLTATLTLFDDYEYRELQTQFGS